MNDRIIIDTGALVAFLCRADRHHDWVTRQLDAVRPPLMTCEAVISETCFLLRRHHAETTAVLALIQRRLLTVPFRAEDENDEIVRLMKKYADLPMSFADACLVRMSERHAERVILTLDHDFQTYRRFERQPIPIMLPSD